MQYLFGFPVSGDIFEVLAKSLLGSGIDILISAEIDIWGKD
jgi:hypothetical protein